MLFNTESQGAAELLTPESFSGSLLSFHDLADRSDLSLQRDRRRRASLGHTLRTRRAARGGQL